MDNVAETPKVHRHPHHLNPHCHHNLRSSSVSSSSTGSLGSSAFPPPSTPPKTSTGLIPDRASTPHNSNYRTHDRWGSPSNCFSSHLLQIKQQLLQLHQPAPNPPIPDSPLPELSIPQTSWGGWRLYSSRISVLPTFWGPAQC